MDVGQSTRLQARGPPIGECRWGSRSHRRVGHEEREGQLSPRPSSWAPCGRKGKPAPPVLVGPGVPGPLSWGGAGSGLQKLRLDPVSCRPRSKGTGSRLALSKRHLIPALGPGGGLLSGAVGPGASAGQSALAPAGGLSWDYPPPGRHGILGTRGHATPSSCRPPDRAGCFLWPFCRRHLRCGPEWRLWPRTFEPRRHRPLCPCPWECASRPSVVPVPGAAPHPPEKQPGEQHLAAQTQWLFAGVHVNHRSRARWTRLLLGGRWAGCWLLVLLANCR